MYAHSSGLNLYSHEQPLMASRTDGMLSSDRSLSFDFPLSPSNQLMYDSEPVQDQCCVGSSVQVDRPVSFDSGVISPSVEGLTFEDYEVLECVFASEPVAPCTSSDDLAGQTADTKYLSDPLKMSDSGPTLAQLNSDDLDLDDFSVSSNGFCVDMSSLDCSQLLVVSAAAAAAAKTVSDIRLAPSTTVTLATCSQRPVQDAVERRQLIQPVLSHLLSSPPQAHAISHTRQPQISASSSSSSLSVSRNSSVCAAQLNLDSSWDVVESFLKSEDERMTAASEAGKHHVQQLPSATQNIKSEAPEMELERDVAHTVTAACGTVKSDAECTRTGSVSDGESLADDNSICELSDFLTDVTSGGGRKEKTYFWQYNTQSKGPKGKRLCRVVQDEDPYVLHDFEDPVFDSELVASASPCYRHSGKARRGDGNDVTPNPAKLYATGRELRKLTHLINAMCPAGELSATVRGRTLREKNKYASRICRLKKKAQHEANKIKLYGLEQEHRQLTKVLSVIRHEVCQRVRRPVPGDAEKLTSRLSKLMKHHLTVMTAGHTVEYVNSVLAKVAAGDTSGGLIVAID